jgi:hypothetical protein
VRKPITVAVVLLAGAWVAYSQGTVSFANYLALSTYIYVSAYGKGIGGTSGPTTGNPASDVSNGNDWTVALYGNSGLGDSASTLTECTAVGGEFATATLANGISDGTPGTWYSGLVAQIPNTTGANQAATLQLLVWYNDGGTITSFSQALALGEPTGASLTANLYETGGNNLTGGLPITAPPLPSGLDIPPMPEPSPASLAIMGALGLLLQSRFRFRSQAPCSMAPK